MALRNPVTQLSSFCSLSGRIIKPKPKGKDVYAFLGVPYAEQPDRFEYPAQLQLWNGCRDATKYGIFIFCVMDVPNQVFNKLAESGNNGSTGVTGFTTCKQKIQQ